MSNWFGRKETDEIETNGKPLGDTENMPRSQQNSESLPAVAVTEPEVAKQQLALLGRAQQAIAKAESVDEVKDIRDKAEAARKYAESASLGLEAQNYAAEVKLRAERKAGELISQLSLHGGDRRSKESDDRVKLERLGHQQRPIFSLATYCPNPEKAFELHINGAKDSATELTTTGVVKLARQLTPRKKSKPRAIEGGRIVTNIDELLAGDERFACIYADPPWRYDNRRLGRLPRTLSDNDRR